MRINKDEELIQENAQTGLNASMNRKMRRARRSIAEANEALQDVQDAQAGLQGRVRSSLAMEEQN